MRQNLSSHETSGDLLKALVSVRSDTGTDMNVVVDCASEMLETRGFSVMRYSFSPTSPCIVASLKSSKGTGSLPREKLILHCHLDTAPFDEPEWRTDPLGAEEINGRIFGRGALDCKGLAAVWISLLGKFKAQACEFPFDLVFIAVSDEECDGLQGTAALLDSTAECDQAFLVIGEGGGYPIRTKSGVYLTLQTGEQEPDFQQEKDNRKTAGLSITRLVRHGMKGTFSPETLRYMVESSLSKTEGVRRLAASPFELEHLEKGISYRLPSNTPGVPGFVLRATRKALREVDRNMRILPVVSRGHSDNRHFRKRGIPTIGYFPLRESNSLKGCHAANEYVTLDSLHFAQEVLESTIINIREAVRG